MTRKEYNGWTNYETWAVKLWMDNYDGFWDSSASDAFESAEADDNFTKEENAIYSLGESIKSHHEEVMPEVQGVFADLLNAAMSEVNWHEIAEALIANAKEEANG